MFLCWHEHRGPARYPNINQQNHTERPVPERGKAIANRQGTNQEPQTTSISAKRPSLKRLPKSQKKAPS
eukprot:5809742-Amphidinium_carterae.1